jgi:ketosteroid isomerase-like protein
MKAFQTLMLMSMILLPLKGVASEAMDTDAIAEEVREQVIAFNKAYEMNELDSYFSYYLDDVSMWINADVVTVGEYKKDWYELIKNGGGMEKFTLSDIMIIVGPGGDSAVAAYGARAHTRFPDGTVTIENGQETDSWFKVDGQWRVAHLHYSSQPVEKE